VSVTAAISIAGPRLRAYLNAPVTRASAWAPREWAGLTGSDDGAGGGEEGELPAAIAECDTWLDGDHAAVLRDLADDELVFSYDEDTASLAVEFTSRVDFRLPSLVWACTVLRGMAGSMADGDRGLVTVTTDWHDDSVLLYLAPGRTAFLDPDRDAAAIARARSWEIDVRSAAGDTDPGEDAAGTIDRLAGG
jgi:hypothetical protein